MKTVLHNTVAAHNDIIEVPEERITEHQEVTLCINTLNMNGVKFLSIISKRIKYCTAEPIPD